MFRKKEKRTADRQCMTKAVLLVNIGSPDEWTVASTRKYLRKFLMDKRVIDVPFLFRFLLVNLIIVPFRAPGSLRSYKRILINGQSPLIYYSYQLETKLQKLLGDAYYVKIAMMYGRPYLQEVLDELQRMHLSEIIVVPLYPQYASSTTGSVLEAVFNHIKNWQVIPNIKTVHTFYHYSEFVDLWTRHIQKHLPAEYDFILFSYHGLPVRQIFKADSQFSKRNCNLSECCLDCKSENEYCYRMNCLRTTQSIVEKLSIDKNKTFTCFQSRLGQSEWLKPYALDYLKELAQKGVKRLVVVSPAFVTDCLETLYEIQTEYAELFKRWGGDKLTLIPSLNVEDEWIKFLSVVVRE